MTMDERSALDATISSLAEEIKHLREDELPKLLPRETARRQVQRMRWVLAGMSLAVIFVGLLGVAFRAQDRASAHRQATSDRANLVAGCMRSNDQRATLREVIEKAIVMQAAPAGLSPDLAELFRQSQERTAKLRADLLALPGVQPVDCQAAFPAKENP
jgi:hypothetical protein